jgi:glycerate kinase
MYNYDYNKINIILDEIVVWRFKMNIVIAIDSFKGSLSSMEAGEAIGEGIRRVSPEERITICPLADGGEGTVEALVYGMKGRLLSIQVTGPLGKPVTCAYGIIEHTKTAIIEMSGAAGITLVPETEKNPMQTTTYGVGEVIKDAITRGCRRFIIGIGGSATNDGGAGMLQALGYEFLDSTGKEIPFGAIGLSMLKTITDTNVIPELKECNFYVACDVTNPLCGELGCSAIYGPQKGATPEMIADMDKWLEQYAALSKKSYEEADANQAGTGAAGGMGFAFLTFTNAVLESGIKIVLEETKLEEKLRDADLVITGEGRLDGQTAMGKAPIGVAKLAKQYGKTVIAFAGSVTRDARECNQYGIDAYFPILRTITTLEEAMNLENAKRNLSDTAEQVYRLYRKGTEG